jgi:hypothetical protein
VTGHWEPRELAWHDTDVANCPVCGRLITTRVWVFDEPDSGGELRTCEPGCEELYFTYLKPTYGALAP